MAKQTTSEQPIYPCTEWDVIETEFKTEHNYRNESIFALGNGYLGIRGTFEEGLVTAERIGQEGTYINGFYESEIIRYPEVAYGFPEKSQTMLNITNGKSIKLFLEDEEFSMLIGTVSDYQRTLCLKDGWLERSLVWTSPQGRQARIEVRRLVSFRQKHLLAIRYRVTPLNFSGKIRIAAILDGDVMNQTMSNDPRSGSGLQGRVLLTEGRVAEGTYGALSQKTKHTNFGLACAMETAITTDDSFLAEDATEQFSATIRYQIDAVEGQPIALDKFVAYVTSLDYPDIEILERATEIARDSKKQGLDSISQEQQQFMADYWAKADVEIQGDLAIQQGIRFNIFHLLQSVGRDGRTNIAAKGLTGEGYEGHYFWDTETYVIPFFLYNSPDISRKLLEYRYSILDKARQRARDMAHARGALFPWRTINGDECSTYYPAGTAQYHINADVAYAIQRYMRATQDTEFLTKYGAEILFETARLWADLGSFIHRKGDKFCINGVTGPDEYTAVVDNNCYTNLMAQENLRYAGEVAQWMKDNTPDDYERIATAIGLQDAELDFWKTIVRAMYIPYDEESGLYMQDDSFMDKTPWDFANTPPENYPLLIHYHPLVIYRHQVCKQADLVLAMFLLSQTFTLEEKRKNYDFYEKLTTHDSSLSTCIFSIMASEIGYHEKAYTYFFGTARMDLDDYHGNVKDGVHVANMAGTWMSLVNGFAGMRTYDDVMSFNPYLPDKWDAYCFTISFKGSVLKVTIHKDSTTYELVEGHDLPIVHRGKQIVIRRNAETVLAN